ncbi:probable calcium-binding protein CML35 [Impatiens glandulifera]|uniref:probable calcium-binding protein CML35 n=1 Tax=Impatiens glandulifera TaxID=253017 RepID=UPI001FB1260B|nr:probable calcium-binding protein CML35 [Impatiens glandulifera]
MKFVKNLSPKNLFRSKKTSSISKSNSDPASLSYGSSSSSDASDYSTHNKSIEPGNSTPKTVLPSSDLIQAFNHMDRNGDGKITREELEAVFNRLVLEPPSDEELTAMLCEVDLDGDGCISLEEFRILGSAFEPPNCRSELRYAFEFFDGDNDGRITAEDLFAGLTAVGDRCTIEECMRMISGVDANGDGFVCFEDFVRMMEKQR